VHHCDERRDIGSREPDTGSHYRAIAFQKPCHKDDARAVIRHLESLTGKHPTVPGLVAKPEKLVAGHC
jgi:hypothetical protein